MLGDAQSGGRSSLRLLRVVNDGDLIVDAPGCRRAVLEADPALQQHAALAAARRAPSRQDERAALGKS